MFTFHGHMPSDPREIPEVIGGNRNITLVKFVNAQKLYDLFGAVRDIHTLDVQNFTALRAYERFVPFPPSSSYAQLVKLKLNVSFQPHAREQLKLISELVSQARSLAQLHLTVTQYPTDEFFNTEKYALRDDPSFNAGLAAQFVPLPAVLNMPTPMERRELEMEAEAKEIGQCLAEALVGVKCLPPPVDPLEAAIENLLKPVATMEGLVVQPHQPQQLLAPLAVEGLVVQPHQPQQLTPLAVKSAAVTRLQEMNAMKVYRYMTKAQWEDVIRIVLDTPFAPSLETLTMQVLFPTPPNTPLRFLSGLVNLEKLQLHYCGIKSKTLEELMPYLAELYSLRVLDLERNDLAGADLAPLGRDLESLVKLLLPHNNLGGSECTTLFQELSKGANSTLSHIDLSYNSRFRTPGLSFDNLDRWAAPDATLLIPNLFTAEEVETRISGCMPDGSTLELVGEYCMPDQEDILPTGLLCA
jgi:hypothetical protein